jgi:protein phosphatase 1 regulatory subunit 7
VITNHNNFKFHQNLGCIEIEETRLNEYVKYINDSNIKEILISSPSYRLNHVNFLKECPGIEKITFLYTRISDFSGLYHLKNLKDLCADEPIGKLDVSHFKNLESLQVNDSTHLIGVGECVNLNFLQLSKFKPKSKNLEELSNLVNIEELRLYIPNITSLKGIENLIRLTELELYRASKLEEIDPLVTLKQNLSILRFETCKKIKNHECLSEINRLEELSLINCGEIENIGFIKSMKNLKKFGFIDTNVVDGDLSPCIGLRFSGFFDKKHYSHKFKELNDKKYW